MSFSSEVWKSDYALDIDDKSVTLRQKMLGDLVDNHLPNKERSDVIDLLGESSNKMDPDRDGPSLSYPTGPQRDSYMAIDSEWLIVTFDSKGYFKGYSLQSD